MSARNELTAIYETWRKWTETEGGAIQAQNWGLVRECQTAKTKLKPRIVVLSETAQTECNRLGQDRAEMEREVRRAVGELILLETRNSETIASLRESASRELAVLDQSGRQLRRLHKLYAPPREAAWQSYS